MTLSSNHQPKSSQADASNKDDNDNRSGNDETHTMSTTNNNNNNSNNNNNNTDQDVNDHTDEQSDSTVRLDVPRSSSSDTAVGASATSVTTTGLGRNSNRRTEPFLIACGYRHVQNPKTGLQFPACLIRLPNGEVRWRSQRDFLYLFRAVRHLQHDTKQDVGLPQVPKAALEKLESKSPWKRPGNWRIHKDEEQQEPQKGHSVVNHDNTVVVNSDKNNYHISMSKNLLKIDQFLNGIQTLCAEPNGSISHTSSSTTTTSTAIAAVANDLENAWQQFIRDCDTEWLSVRRNESLNEQPSPPPTLSTSSTKGSAGDQPTALSMLSLEEKSSKLGQYFCTKDNAAQVCWQVNTRRVRVCICCCLHDCSFLSNECDALGRHNSTHPLSSTHTRILTLMNIHKGCEGSS